LDDKKPEIFLKKKSLEICEKKRVSNLNVGEAEIYFASISLFPILFVSSIQHVSKYYYLFFSPVSILEGYYFVTMCNSLGFLRSHHVVTIWLICTSFLGLLLFISRFLSYPLSVFLYFSLLLFLSFSLSITL
jgi:hypothetical protein